MCKTTGLIFTKFFQSNYWSKNKFCQLSFFKSNNGYEGDDCCKNQTPVLCKICTNDATPWMIKNEKNCESTGIILTKFHQSNYLANNKFFRQSSFKTNIGYEGDECRDNQTHEPCNI